MWHNSFWVMGHLSGAHLLLLLGLCGSAGHAANGLTAEPGGAQASSAKPADAPAALPTPGGFRDPRTAPLDPVTSSGSAGQPNPSQDPEGAQAPSVARPRATKPQPTAQPTAQLPAATRRPAVFPSYPGTAARERYRYESRPPRVQPPRRARPYPGYPRWRGAPWGATHPRSAGYPRDDYRLPGGLAPPNATPAYPSRTPAPSPQDFTQSKPAATRADLSSDHPQDAAAQPVNPPPAAKPRPESAPANTSKNAIGPPQEGTGAAGVGQFRPPELE